MVCVRHVCMCACACLWVYANEFVCMRAAVHNIKCGFMRACISGYKIICICTYMLCICAYMSVDMCACQCTFWLAEERDQMCMNKGA